MKIRLNKVMRASEKKPNRPKTDDPRQDPRSKAKHKTQHSGRGGASPARSHHGLTVAAGFPPDCFDFSQLFVFPRDFSSV